MYFAYLKVLKKKPIHPLNKFGGLLGLGYKKDYAVLFPGVVTVPEPTAVFSDPVP